MASYDRTFRVVQLVLLVLRVGVTSPFIVYKIAEPPCTNLAGTWYNQVGSTMELSHGADGSLKGRYRTAVEREAGAAGTSSHSPIIGRGSNKGPGGVVGFTVLWKDGDSVTAWTGQCHVCDGKEVLMMSWVLRMRQPSCDDVWQSTLIGQGRFTREEQVTTEESQTELSAMEHMVSKRDVPAAVTEPGPCSLEGFWYNDLGSEMYLTHHQNGSISGAYQSAVSRVPGMTSQHQVFGMASPNDSNTTVSLFVVWNGGKAVTGWVGQCHLCGVQRKPVLETVWLQRLAIPGCHNNWRSTFYGSNRFSREAQKQGPRTRDGSHTPEEDGEYFGWETCGSQPVAGSSAILSGLAVLFVIFQN